jgi:hypothetical protein
MKYKDTFIRYYLTNRLKELYETFLENFLNYWWCDECKKYHSSRVKMYSKTKPHKLFYEVWDGNTCSEIQEKKELKIF